jgi:hypothetical protein
MKTKSEAPDNRPPEARPRSLPVRMMRMLGGMLRAAAYLGTLGLVILFFYARTVRGQIAEKTLALGRDLSSFQDLLHGVHRVRLNGEPLYVASALSDQSMTEILDRFERHCNDHSGGLREQFDSLPQEARDRLAKQIPVLWKQRLGTIREERKDEAFIACLERRPGNGLTDAVKSLRAFAATGDLHEIGNLRYVYARPTETGKVHVLSTVTEGSFNLYRILGKDAAEPAGSDPPGAPRPPGSRRVLSAELDGSMFGAHMFSVSQPPEDVLQFYDRELPSRGWSRLAGHGDLAIEIWQREGVTMVVHAVRLSEGDLTKVTFAEGRTTAPSGG